MLMQLQPYLGSFYVFLLVWWRKFKINQEYRGWVGNETSASDLDRKYVGYPTISDTLFSLILIFFPTYADVPSWNFLQKGLLTQWRKLFFFNLTDQMTIFKRWVIVVISIGNTKWCFKSVATYQYVLSSNNDDLCILLCERFELLLSLTICIYMRACVCVCMCVWAIRAFFIKLNIWTLTTRSVLLVFIGWVWGIGGFSASKSFWEMLV